MSAIETGLLSGVRIADLTGTFGAYATRLLADHGACVVRIVPDTGDPAEAVGPFDPDSGASYFAKFVNANKRSVTVSPQVYSSSAFLADILDWADVVVEELPQVGGWQEAALASSLKARGKDTVVVSIRPFAEGSSLTGQALDDLAAQAIGGLMALSGNPDREPLALNGGQAYYIVGVFGASAALLGLGDTGGEDAPPHYVVTVQEAIVNSLETAIQYYTTEGVVRGRKGAAQQAGDGSYQVKDGRVVLGAMTDLEWGRLATWMGKLGCAEAPEFARWALDDRRNPDKVKHFAATFEALTRDFTCEALTTAGQANRVLISPSYKLTQILRDGQLTYDQFFRPVADSQGNHWVFPGAPYRVSSGSVLVREGARRLGEDNDWFLRQELGRPDKGTG